MERSDLPQSPYLSNRFTRYTSGGNNDGPGRGPWHWPTGFVPRLELPAWAKTSPDTAAASAWRRMVAAGAPTAAVQHQGRWKHGDMVRPLHSGRGRRRGAEVADLIRPTDNPEEAAMTDSARPVCDCPEPCACYAEGSVQGKEKAHFEIRAVLDSNHSASCGCEPCRTVREVVARRLLASNSSAPFE